MAAVGPGGREGRRGGGGDWKWRKKEKRWTDGKMRRLLPRYTAWSCVHGLGTIRGLLLEQLFLLVRLAYHYIIGIPLSLSLSLIHSNTHTLKSRRCFYRLSSILSISRHPGRVREVSHPTTNNKEIYLLQTRQGKLLKSRTRDVVPQVEGINNYDIYPMHHRQSLRFTWDPRAQSFELPPMRLPTITSWIHRPSMGLSLPALSKAEVLS